MDTNKSKIIFKNEARKEYVNADGTVNWTAVRNRYTVLKNIKESLGNKYFTDDVERWAQSLPNDKQHRLLDIMIGGLSNDDASVGVYATKPDDYDEFGLYLEPIIREYHGITDDTKQTHDWEIPVGIYELSAIDPSLSNLSMRARVARNVNGWNLTSSMDKEESVAFETFMEAVLAKLPFDGTYRSLTPGHPHELSQEEADEWRKNHYLFNDMTSDNHLTASGIASDWPYGRGIWLSVDKTKMIWIGEEDHLRIISIVHGSDLGLVDASLRDLLEALSSLGVDFAEHGTYGVVTTCPTNMGTGKRQSVLGKFPNLSERGTNEARLKEIAKGFGLQARGLSGEHSQMDAAGTADISPRARFGVTEAEVARRLYEGLHALYTLEFKEQ